MNITAFRTPVAKTKHAPKERLSAPLTRYFPFRGVAGTEIATWDGSKISVVEVRGVEPTGAVHDAFSAALNALEFPVQFLVRQHPPNLQRVREETARMRPENLAAPVLSASRSLEALLEDLESRPGVLDRRFYAAASSERAGELSGLLSRAGISTFALEGHVLRSLVDASIGGAAPGGERDNSAFELTTGRTSFAAGRLFGRAFTLSKWPRALGEGFLQRLFQLGVPMDASLHVAPIPVARATRMLEWQKVKFESSLALSLRRGRSPSPEAEMALEDIVRLREEVHRGHERLFHASLAFGLYARDKEALDVAAQKVKGFFSGALAGLSDEKFRQREAHLSTLPIAQNVSGGWRTVDTSSLALLFPFAPPDLDTRRGALFGLDLRSGAPVTFDPFDKSFLNANVAVLARSGAGKSFSVKLMALRGIARGTRYYVIDPEGEYAGLAESAGGRVLSPGRPGHGLNPFVIAGEADDSETLQRVSGLRRLVEVMVGERFRAQQRAVLDQALSDYYRQDRSRSGFRDFFAFVESAAGHDGFPELAGLLRPFATGSLRHLLDDGGADLLAQEAPVTVFNLRHLEPELRPAATMVCAEAVWALATRDPRPRALVVDEVWSIMQHPEGAAAMVSLAKRARKHSLGLVCITQDVQDFLSDSGTQAITGHTGRVLLQNSAFKLLLQQDAAAIESVERAFDLSAEDARWLLSSPRGDGLLIGRGGRFSVRIEAAEEERRLIEFRQGGHS